MGWLLILTLTILDPSGPREVRMEMPGRYWTSGECHAAGDRFAAEIIEAVRSVQIECRGAGDAT